MIKIKTNPIFLKLYHDIIHIIVPYIISGQRNPSRSKRNERFNDCGRSIARGVPHTQAGDGPGTRVSSPAGDHAGLRALPLEDPGGESWTGTTDGG